MKKSINNILNIFFFFLVIIAGLLLIRKFDSKFISGDLQDIFISENYIKKYPQQELYKNLHDFTVNNNIITSTSNNPWIIVDTTGVNSFKYLKIDIDLLGAGYISSQFFFSGREGQFNELDSKRHILKNGTNYIIVHSPGNGKLRIDLTETKDTSLFLNSVELTNKFIPNFKEVFIIILFFIFWCLIWFLLIFKLDIINIIIKFYKKIIKNSLFFNNFYKNIKSLNVWEYIFVFFLIFGVVIIIHFIFNGSISFFNSDTATANLLAREQIHSKQFFPKEWVYVNDVWTFFINIPMIFLSIFIKNQILLRCISVFIQTILFLLILIIYDKYIFKNKSYLIYGAILFSFISNYYLENMFAQAAYCNGAILTLLIFLFATFSVNEDFKFNKKHLIIFCILSCISCVSGVRNIGVIIIPLVGSFTLVYIIDNNNESLKKISQDLKKYFLWILFIFVSIIIGFFIFRLVITNSYFNSDSTDLFIRSWSDINNIFETIKNTISWLLFLFGIGNSVKLFSLSGIIYMLKYFLFFTFMFILPILLTKKYTSENIFIKRLIVFSWLSLLIIFVLFIMTDKLAIDFASIRYFQISMIFQIILSSYYLNKYLIKKNIFLCFITVTILTFYLLTNLNTGTKIAFNKNYINIIKENNELKSFLLEKDLKFGYATYWNAYKYSVFFNFEPEIVAVTIWPELYPISPFYHLTSKRYYQPEYNIGRTFLLLSKDQYEIYKNDMRFNDTYGEPEEIYEKNNFYIIVFNYNIIEKNKIEKGGKRNLLPYLALNEFVKSNTDNIINIEKNGFIFGPYWTLDKGKYELYINCEYLESDEYLNIRIYADFGNTDIPLIKNMLVSGENKIEFWLQQKTDNVEIFIYNTQFEYVKIDEIVLMWIE